MEEKNNQMPELHISVTNLELTVEEGKVPRGTFLVESVNKVPVKGRVHSTNDKMGLENPELTGIRQEITYYFKGKLATAGSEFEGDFVLITNGGEYNIPYRIRVVPKRAETSIGEVSDMEQFTLLYEKDVQEAMELFFLPNFSEVFLKEEPEKKALYHSLMKGRSRSLILEEFMTAAGYKEPSELSVENKTVILDAGKDRETILLKLSSPGYLEGTIKSEKGQVQLSMENFTSRNFSNGELEITIEKNHNYAMGNDVVHISTVRQEYEIPVEWWGTLPAYTKEREKKSRIRRQQAELMHNYLYFRTGSIDFDDFATESAHVLDDLVYLTEDINWKLFKVHLLLMEESFDEAKELLKEIEEYEEKESLSGLASCYLLYLRAMLFRTPDVISKAVTSIREFYEVGTQKAEALWMLIYLDREYVYNKRLQYDTIRQLIQSGNNSCLLYFEACEILNENPNYMEELGSFEVSIFRWGVRYGYISMSLAYQFARLALKMKFYSNSIFYIAQKLYSVEPDERFLQVICSLLIKGNRTGKEYHDYFRRAVEANLKIIGLNEFFIRSMDYKQYEIIPQRVLIYFTYSNSLDSVEKACLYTNVLKNKEAYEEVFGAYYAKMGAFVEEQLLKGKMNEHLAFLYHHFQKEILEKPENAKAVCDILFYRKLICKNKNMIGVYVTTPEMGEEIYCPLSSGVCYVQIYNHRTGLFFTDSNEQRYACGIEYEWEPFLSLQQFPKEWIRKNMINKKVLLSLSACADNIPGQEDLPVLERIAFHKEYLPWMQERALEKLLVYHENHQNKTELSRWLERTDYFKISPAFRKHLMDFYMEVGMIENAYFGIELYGCQIMGAVKRLKLATFGVQHAAGKLDETTLSLAWSAFVSKKYNRDTLTYLMKFFDGELEDLLSIWERSRKLQLETGEFEPKILEQSMFTGNDTAGIFPVFESFYEKEINPEIAARYLEYMGKKEIQGSLELPESIHAIVGQEIMKGNITGRTAKVHFLYYFAQRKEWHDKIEEVVKAIVGEFMEEEYYLPVYYAFADRISFPPDYLERTFLTYRGESGRKVIVYYQTEGSGEETAEKRLKEVLPGLYVCSMHFYQSDHVNYHLEEDGEPVKNIKDLQFETFEYDGEDSRFFELNRLSVGDYDKESLNQYLRKAYFTDHFIKLM